MRLFLLFHDKKGLTKFLQQTPGDGEQSIELIKLIKVMANIAIVMMIKLIRILHKVNYSDIIVK